MAAITLPKENDKKLALIYDVAFTFHLLISVTQHHFELGNQKQVVMGKKNNFLSCSCLGELKCAQKSLNTDSFKKLNEKSLFQRKETMRLGSCATTNLNSNLQKMNNK